MQTKKKHLGRNGTRELPSCKSNRQQKKVTEPTHFAEKKAADLITSSARKQRFVGIISKKNRDAAKNPTVGHIFAGDETQNICSAYKAIDMASTDHKGCKERSVQCGLDTIFSPAFHISKDVGCIITSRGDVVEFFGDVVQQESVRNMLTEVSTCPSNRGVDSFTMYSEYCDLKNDPAPTFSRDSDAAVAQCNEKDNVAVNLSSEVSAIYLAMQQSKLECVDEASQDSMSIEACAEAEDEDAYDNFDPYLFIKNLPELSAVVPAFRPVLLPKQTRSCPPTTLVLDLDETLVHSTLEHCEDVDFTFPVTLNLKEHTVYVRCRPHLKDFMECVASLFEIIIFTASQSIYAEQLLNVLDPRRRIFRHRVYRESCVFVDGNYLKDLSVLGRDLAHVIIIDNSPQAFGFQVDNGIPIESWFDDRSDQALLSLLPFLESLVAVEDVRPLIAKKFNLREKVAAAIDPSLNFNNGTPFDW